jgi:hypothetical protein
MIEAMSEKEMEREIEELLKTAEDYLWRAKVNKSKNSQNFEIMLALEYATKARDKSKHLMHVKEFYDNANRRAEVVLDELSKLQSTFTRRKSPEEMKYEEGDIGGG